MRLPHLIALSLCLLMASTATAQRGRDSERLRVGSDAPGFDVEDWVVGDDMEIEEGKVYAFIFFPPNCIECRTLFPILNEYKAINLDRDVEIVAVTTGDKYTTKTMLAQIPEEITFNIGIDRRASTQRAWVVASGFRGFLVGYIVDKKSKVQYIGYPGQQFINILSLVMEGRYEARLWAKAFPMLEAAEDARKLRNYRLAHKMYDEVIEVNPEIFAIWTLDKFEMMLIDQENREGAYEYARKLLEEYSDDGWLLMRLAEKIASDIHIPDELRDFDVALAAAERAAGLFASSDPERYSVPATVHFHAGRIDKAVKLQRQAYMVARPIRKPVFKRPLEDYRAAQRRHRDAARAKDK